MAEQGSWPRMPSRRQPLAWLQAHNYVFQMYRYEVDTVYCYALLADTDPTT